MRIILSFGLLICSTMIYANEDMNLKVRVDASDFEVTLPSNPTTGFQWSVAKFDKNLLVLSHSNFERPKNNLIGAGGQMHYTFKLKKQKTYPKSTEIEFKYARGWEPDSATLQKVKVQFIGENAPLT